MKHANLKKRIMAYIIDMFIVSMIISIVTVGYDNSRLDNLNKELDDVSSSYFNGDISSDKYIESVAGISYDVNKANVVSNTLYVVVCVGYFVLFQYLNGGCSIGKKLMHIRIVNKSGGNVNLFSMFVRTSVVNDIVPTVLIFGLLYLVSGVSYMFFCGIINFISFVYMIVSIFMIRFRDDRLSINDIMSGSIVIEDK